MSELQNLPRRQDDFLNISQRDIDDNYAIMLLRLFEGIPISPEKVKTAIDLYCGNGVMAAAALGYFPNATVHTVDVHDGILAPYLQQQQRIQFHQGLAGDILLSDLLPPAEFVSISEATSRYGLTELHKDPLKKLVRGHLLTIGDNGDLENSKWFRDAFKPIKGTFYETIWIPR